MEEDDRVLEANTAFYRAFSSGDINAMEVLWATKSTAATTHPWRPALVGRQDVMDSWRAILVNPPSIRFSEVVVTRLDGFALVTCLEEAGDVLSATNVFVLEEGEWKICHHHAGPVAPIFYAKARGMTSVH